MDLNKDVLKRTNGLLSEIDRVLAEPLLAERVQRTLESAAPSLGIHMFANVEEWEKYEFDDDYSAERLLNYCQCDKAGDVTVDVTYPDNPKSDHSYSIGIRHCQTDHLGRYVSQDKHEPFAEAGIAIELSYSGGRAADVPCGYPGCACEDIIEANEMCQHCHCWIRRSPVDPDLWIDVHDGDTCCIDGAHAPEEDE